MRQLHILLGLMCFNSVFGQGCIIGGQPSVPHYVCFDGRTAERDTDGFVWHAKRGCFLSTMPCCFYNATHYAFYANPERIGGAYARCRKDYPFKLGEMQTH